jgi:MFS family permease
VGCTTTRRRPLRQQLSEAAVPTGTPMTAVAPPPPPPPSRASAPTSAAPAAAAPPPGDRWLLVSAFLTASAAVAVFVLLPELQAELGLSTAALGPITAASFLAAVVAQVVLTPLVDRGRARAVLVGALVTSAAGLAATALATSALTLVLARTVEGIALGAFLPAARALISRRAAGSDALGDGLGHRLGRLSAAEFAGYAIGPLVVAVVAEARSVDAALLAFAVLSLGAVPLVWRGAGRAATVAAPRSGEGPPRSGDGPGRPAYGLGFDLFRRRRFVGALLLVAGVMIPVGAYDTLWARFLTDNGASTLVVGASLTAFAIPYVLLAGSAGRLADRIGVVRAAAIGLLTMAAVMVAYGLLREVGVIVALGLVESSGQALAGPAGQVAVSRSVDGSRVGAAQGMSGAVGTLLAGLVALVAAPVYATAGAAGLFIGTAGVVVLVLVGGAALLRGHERGGARRAGRPEPVG